MGVEQAQVVFVVEAMQQFGGVEFQQFLGLPRALGALTSTAAPQAVCVFEIKGLVLA